MTDDEISRVPRNLRAGDRIGIEYTSPNPAWDTREATVMRPWKYGAGGAGSSEAADRWGPDTVREIGYYDVRLDGYDYGSNPTNCHQAHCSIITSWPEPVMPEVETSIDYKVMHLDTETPGAGWVDWLSGVGDLVAAVRAAEGLQTQQHGLTVKVVRQTVVTARQDEEVWRSE